MSNKQTQSLLNSRRFLLLVALVFLILVLTFFFGDSGILEIIKTQDKIEVLQENINRLEKEKQALSEEIEELKHDPLALEKKAREKLWLMKRNEKVVVIIKEKKKGETGTDKKPDNDTSDVRGGTGEEKSPDHTPQRRSSLDL